MDKKHIKRRLFEDLKGHLDKKEISIIVGPRQVGKTTLMKELIVHIQKIGGKSIFLNLDYEPDKVYLESQDSLINKLHLEFGNQHAYVFIDEIQRKKDAGLFLKGLYDIDLPYKFIVSGSGSLELKESIHESLAGRKRMFELSPIDFFEFIDFRTDYAYTNRLQDFFVIEKTKTADFLKEYLNYGGYPRVILSSTTTEKSQVISEIFSSVIERDISILLNINRPDAFSLMIKLLSSQNGMLVKHSELAKQVGVSASVIKKYIWYAEKTFITYTLSPFSSNKQKEILKSPIPYFYDIGMRNFSIGQFGSVPQSTGFIFQNIVANMLRSSLEPIQSLHFWRTTNGAEVDFIICRQNETIPIEVKYSDMDEVEVTRSLRSYIEEYEPKVAYVVNKSFSGSRNIKNTQVIAIPFYKCADITK